jgi:hypothetical protein
MRAIFRNKSKKSNKHAISIGEEDTQIAKAKLNKNLKGSCDPISSPCCPCSPCSPCNPCYLPCECCGALGVVSLCVLSFGGVFNLLRCFPQDDCCNECGSNECFYDGYYL